MSAPHRPLRPTRAHILALMLGIVLAGGAAAGCLGTRGPVPLDLSTPRARIAQDGERLRRIGQVVRRDLDQIGRLRADFEAGAHALYQPPFPLDLFKHVAVDCFNEPYQVESTADPDASTSPAPAAEVGLECSPEYTERLMVALHERAPQREAEAIRKLRTLDALRQLRGRLRFRIGQVPAILRESRRTLATRRADLRRMRDAEARRRTEYSGERWQEMQRRFDAFEQDLQGLSAEIDRLAEAWPSWTPVVDAEISRLYAYLTALSATNG